MDLNNKSKEELLTIAEALDALEANQKYNKINYVFPDTGKNNRSLYPKHMEFLRAGSTHLIRAFIAANRIGKSFLCAFEVACHVTGLYPTWWVGKRFTRPNNWWVVGIDTKQIRPSIQPLLFGGTSDYGTGLIPKSTLLDDNNNLTTKGYEGVTDLVGTCRVRWVDKNGVFGGWSQLEVKTYLQGWMAFQGAKRDGIWLDEEPMDPKIYTECLTRLMGEEGEEGIMLCSFTPLHGYTTFLLGFLPDGQCPTNGTHPTNPDKYAMMASWDDCPHLSERAKTSLLQEYLKTDPNAVEARTKGIAAMGSGRVYPIDEGFTIVPQFRIPAYWKRGIGIDPGQSNFAVVWIAEDPNTGIKYIYDEYKHGKVNYIIHIDAIKSRGEWIRGGLDPHEAVKPRDTGESVESYFESHGLQLTAGTKDSNAWRIRIRAEFDAGTIKICNNCTGILSEIRTYRYDMDDPNKIARGQDDHRLDAFLYGRSVFDQIGMSYAEVEEELYADRHSKYDDSDDAGRNPVTGY